MRVLVAVATLHPAQLALWRAAQARGVDVQMVGTTAPLRRERVAYSPGPPVDLPSHVVEAGGPGRLRDRGYQWWVLRGLDQVVDEVDPDVLHVLSEPWGLMSVQAVRLGRPTVVHSWDNLYRHGRPVEDVIRAQVARWVLRRVAGHASASSTGVRLARQHGLPATTPTAVVAPVVPDPQAFRSASRAHRRVGRDGVVQVGYVGRLDAEKGLPWLLDAWDRAGPGDRELVLAGDGHLRHDVERYAARHADVRYLGPVPPDDVAELLAELDAVVVPSRSRPDWEEQYGRIVVEAMFAGTAVVVSDSGALPEVVGPGGIIVPEGDTEALARELERLGDDASHLSRTRAASTERGLAHEPSVRVDSLISVWREAIR